MSKIERPLRRNSSFFMVALGLLIIINGCSSGSLTTREKGAGIGAVGGAAAGALIGAAVAHPGALALPLAEGSV